MHEKYPLNIDKDSLVINNLLFTSFYLILYFNVFLREYK